MRLIGVGPAVRNALDQATPSECLLVYQASDWADDLAGGSRPVAVSLCPRRARRAPGPWADHHPVKSEAAGGRYPGGSENCQGSLSKSE